MSVSAAAPALNPDELRWGGKGQAVAGHDGELAPVHLRLSANSAAAGP